jgi:hypothetical protein
VNNNAFLNNRFLRTGVMPLLALALISGLPIAVLAQTNPNEYDEEKKVLYKKENSFGINIHTNGFGGNLRFSRHLTGYKKRTYEFELVSFKHPKEIKSVNPYYDNAKSYIYGKLNSVLLLRSSIGLQKTIYSKAERGGVEVRLNTAAGVTLGFAKPVYLEIGYPEGVIPYEFVKEEPYNPDKHFVDNIYGRAPFTKGFDKLKLHPGGYAKIGVLFEYGAYDDDVKALEIGAAIDAFPEKIRIMAKTTNSQAYVTFYISLIYGRKKN